MKDKKNGMIDIAVIGMALFATFFGAGNLIFPPYLGINAGSDWFIGFLCFFIADVGVALAAIFAMIKTGDISINGLTGKLGKVPSYITNILIILCIGPFLCIPRTAATTFEMGVMPIFPSINSWVFGAVFFSLVLLFTIRPSGVIDIIGKFFTPALVACLLGLIVIGYLHPIGDIVATTNFDTAKEGVLAGYQTMDVLVSIVFIITIVTTAHSKGYTETKSTVKIITQSSFFAAIALFVVYGGLCYLGATTSGGGFEGYNQSILLVAITQKLIGNYGILILGIIVFFACITTAIGLVSSCASVFVEMTHNKISYTKIVIIEVIFSYFISNFGISTIISIAGPILTLLYPVILVMIILSFFSNQIKNDNIYIGAAAMALLASGADVLFGFGLPFEFAKSLPLATFQCGWVVPAIIGGIIGKFIPMTQKSILVSKNEGTDLA